MDVTAVAPMKVIMPTTAGWVMNATMHATTPSSFTASAVSTTDARARVALPAGATVATATEVSPEAIAFRRS